MSDGTHIEWCDATWNIITGCSVVSAGCKHCYAMKLAGTRLQHHPSRAGLTTSTAAGPVWNGQVRFNEQWLSQPLAWRRPRRIFVCAHGDLFHESVPDDWIDQVFAVMAVADWHTFQVLTKRAARMRAYLCDPATVRRIAAILAKCLETTARCALQAYLTDDRVHDDLEGFQLPNVWLGVSVEHQEAADARIPDLMATPAAVRWISAEPLLGPVNLVPFLSRITHVAELRPGAVHQAEWTNALAWVVAGGESGAGARPMHPDWARSLRDQCAAAGVAFMFKQWGDWSPYMNEDHFTECQEEKHAHAWVDGETAVHGDCWLVDDDGMWSNYTGDPRCAPGEKQEGEWNLHPAIAVMGRHGKKAAGRRLDGVLHDAYPNT
jgi:protein gp37